MRKIIYYFSFVALVLALSACTKKTTDPTAGGSTAVKLADMTFTCSSDGDGSLKTCINNNGKVIWTAGDKIRVYTTAGDPKGYSLTLTSGAGTSTGTFQGVCPEEGPYYALYPDYFTEPDASDYPFEDEKVYILTHPMGYSDKYMDKSFDPQSKNAFFVSYSEDTKMHFQSVFGYLGIQLYGVGEISRIQLRFSEENTFLFFGRVSVRNPDDIEIVDGPYWCDFADLDPMKDQPNMFLTDDVEHCITPVFVIPPGNLSSGFTVDFFNKDGFIVEGARVSTDKDQTIQRGVMRTMPPIRVVIDEKPTDCGSITPNRQIDAITDGSGNTYDIVKIGEQWWMSEDLVTLKYSDGIDIASVDDIVGDIPEDNPQPFYNNKLAGHVLYTWSAAMRLTQAEVEAITDVNQYKNRQGVCPNGWHIPSKDDYDELVSFLRCSGYAGLYLKASSTAWGDYPGFDCYGFGAMPCCADGDGRGNDFRATPITNYGVSYFLSEGARGWFSEIEFNWTGDGISSRCNNFCPVRCIKDK